MLGFDGRSARAAWTTSLVILALWLVYLVRSTLFIFVVAVLFAYLMAPLVDFLNRFLPGKSRTPALALAYLMLVGLLVLAIILIGSRVVEQASALAKDFPAKAAGWLDSFQAGVPEALKSSVAEKSSDLFAALPEFGLKFLTLASNLIYVVIVPVLAFFLLKDGGAIRKHILELVDVGPRRALLDEVLADIDLLLAHYMRALVLLSLGSFTACSIFLSVMQVPYSILVAVVAALLEFIPMVGPLAAAAIILLVAAVSGGHVVAVLIFIIAFRMVQDYVVSPHLMGQGVELHPALVLFGVFAGAEVAGIAGTFLSVPLLALARIIYIGVRRSRLRLIASKDASAA